MCARPALGALLISSPPPPSDSAPTSTLTSAFIPPPPPVSRDTRREAEGTVQERLQKRLLAAEKRLQWPCWRF